MSGELEAAGAMATAGLAAGAIEGREAHGAHEGACLNCGAALGGAYCSACGQAAHAHRTLSHMFEEVLHGLIHFDAKAWRTLPMLAFRPGTLTRGYIYGKRARYISPLALFLFTIFLMFFVFSFTDANIFQVNVNGPAGAEMRADLQRDLADARVELQRAETELAADRAAHDGAAPTRAQEARERAIEVARLSVTALEQRVSRAEAPQASVAEAAAPASATPSQAPQEAQTWQEELSNAAKRGDINVNTPFPLLNARVLHSLENPDLALYKIQNAAYKFSFLLVPLSLPFMWLLFLWRRGLTLYDHVVFTLYSLSFASIVFVIVALTANMPWLKWMGGAAFFLGMPVHAYFHLKGAYALGWWSALWRTFLLLLFALIVLALFVISIVLLGMGG